MSGDKNQSPKVNTYSLSNSKSEILDTQEKVVHRTVKSEIQNINQNNLEEENQNQLSKSESGNYSIIIIYGLIILSLIIGLVIGYKIIKEGNVQDEQQMDVFVNIISKSLLNDLEQHKFLIIDDQRKQLKKFYEKIFSNILWQKIVKYIQQQPNVLLSKDNKKWILKD
ncbi:unnamed protein product [Paramecium sonneborni]|uniref:Transmembrane protein n=1 Tax=Paramecium sonneborni TaxID=65129 RepID=A0A8S1R5U2_9CILI|nr:unnamed protein product [Paramecium sonneborni]